MDFLQLFKMCKCDNIFVLLNYSEIESTDLAILASCCKTTITIECKILNNPKFLKHLMILNW